MRTTKRNFKQFVHSFVDARGVTRWAVGDWDDTTQMWTCPLTEKEQTRYGEKTLQVTYLDSLGGTTSRTQALRRARYLYGDREAEASQEDK